MDENTTEAGEPMSQPHTFPTSKRRGWLALAGIATGLLVAAGFLVLRMSSNGTAAEWKPQQPLDAKRAIGTIEKLCSFGPRVSGTRGMEAQQDWLRQEFSKLGGKIEFQEFARRHPLDGTTVNMKNMIVRFGPDTGERLLICAHYDTRPFPDNDRINPRGRFLGANDGASGPSLMIELANSFAVSPPKIGVDLVLFDAEELVYGPQDEYFIGSSYFARDYRANTDKGIKYRKGVLADMIADKQLELYYEVNSFRFARELTEQIWRIAAEEKIPNFIAKLGHEVRDDHFPLNEIANIPTCDIIDFDYPARGRRGINYWHTTEDLPNKCSGVSVCKVATVLLAWIREEQGN